MSRLLAVPHVAVNVKNRLGDTALHQMSWKGHSECVRRLRASPAAAAVDLGAANADGKTAEQLAEDAETRAELERWSRAVAGGDGNDEGRDRGDYAKEDYGDSDHGEEEDEDEEGGK